MTDNPQSSIQHVTWPHHPGQYLHGAKPREKVVTNRVLMSILTALNAQLVSNPKTREIKGGV